MLLYDMLFLLAPPLPLRLISYELLQDSPTERMRVIISSQFLYFFRRSPPDPSSLEARFSLDSIVECRPAQGKSSTLLLSVSLFL